MNSGRRLKLSGAAVIAARLPSPQPQVVVHGIAAARLADASMRGSH